ncbi:MAG: hypothetical protein FJZ01_20360 [Candidatus Sericytochromatia bacterium]|nr:hypothetical protein [Candidatus Tanganyikabacteria bacterium]
MKSPSLLPAALALSLGLAGCNLTSAQIQGLVDKLVDVAVKIQVAGVDGKPRTLSKADIKQIFVDGKEVAADKFDVVNGQIKLKGVVERNSGQKPLKVVLQDGTVIDGADLDTTEGKENGNEASFIAGPGGRMTEVAAGKSLDQAYRDQLAEARKSGVVVKLGASGITSTTIEAVGVQRGGATSADPVYVLPATAYTATTDGGIVFDVRFLTVLVKSAAEQGASEDDIKNSTWYVAYDATTSGKYMLEAFKFDKKLEQADLVTGKLPAAQTVAKTELRDAQRLGPMTWEEMVAGTQLVYLDEFGRIPDAAHAQRVGGLEGDDPQAGIPDIAWGI